jgi:hypothetical protein
MTPDKYAIELPVAAELGTGVVGISEDRDGDILAVGRENNVHPSKGYKMAKLRNLIITRSCPRSNHSKGMENLAFNL